MKKILKKTGKEVQKDYFSVMNKFQLKKPKKIIYILSAVIGIMVPLFFTISIYLKKNEFSLYDFTTGVGYSVFETFWISYFALSVIDYFQLRFPWNRNIRKRLVYEFLVVIGISIIVTTILLGIFYVLFDRKYTGSVFPPLFDNIILAIFISTILVSLYEGAYFIRQWKKSLVEAERLKRESIESQYAALKNQINPHFLFNCLNTLSSLINISPDRAVDFVNKFSKIYRYVLDVKDKMMVELHREAEFINSYYYLQKIRYSDNLIVDIKIQADKLMCYVPPLTLQLLVENAIKHNEISGEFPLKIIICCDDNFLYVINSLKKKNADEFSTGIGLVNLKERYAHFSDIQPEFYVQNNDYIAKVPLLKEE